MSNKLTDLSEEKKKHQEDEAYFKGRPTRMEVANYVNGLMEKEYIPSLVNSLNGLNLGLMVLQAILIEKGICTGEEIEDITKEFVERAKAPTNSSKEKLKD